MEFANRGRSTAAVDDGRCFPDPPPPRGGDADPAPVDGAALVFRRETLLRELHKERIRQEMILCELAETESAMAACLAAGHQSTTPMPILRWPPGDWLSTPAARRDAWRGRPPPMSALEETLYRTPRSSEQASWWRRSPSEPVIPPVYPHVERSPSPVPQPRPVDDAEQQERGSSSRTLAITPACPDVEQRRSLSKEPVVEGASVPAVTNAVAKPTERGLFSEEVTPDRRAILGQDREGEAKDSHAAQLMEESGMQSSEQPKPAEPTIEELRQSPRQYTLAGNEKSPSDEQKRLELNEPKPQITPCGVKRGMPCLTSLLKRHKPLVEWSCTLCRVNLTCEEKLAQHRAGQLHQSNLAASEARLKTTAPIAKSTPESSHGAHRHNAQPLHRSDSKNMENSGLQEAKRACGFDSPNHPRGRTHRENTEGNNDGGQRANGRMGEDLRKKLVNKTRLHFCELCKVQCNSKKMLESHLGGKKHRENTEGNNEGGQRANGRMGEDLRKKLVNKTRLHFCELCKVQCNSKKMLESHLGGKKHRENTEGNNEGGQRANGRMGEDLRKKLVNKTRLHFCELCKVQCNSKKMLESHLGGKKHREMLQERH